MWSGREETIWIARGPSGGGASVREEGDMLDDTEEPIDIGREGSGAGGQCGRYRGKSYKMKGTNTGI